MSCQTETKKIKALLTKELYNEKQIQEIEKIIELTWLKALNEAKSQYDMERIEWMRNLTQ